MFVVHKMSKEEKKSLQRDSASGFSKLSLAILSRTRDNFNQNGSPGKKGLWRLEKI